MEISKELKEQAKACKTAEELVALAKANDIELSVEEADFLLKDVTEGELTECELDNVAGGTDGCIEPTNPYELVYWDTKEEVQYIFNVGDTVQAFSDLGTHHTATCRVTDRRAAEQPTVHEWYDQYYLEKVEGCRTPFISAWTDRKGIEK